MNTTVDYAYYSSALEGVSLPAAVLDLDALEANAQAVLTRAGHLPVRLGSKSIRVRGVIERLLASDERYAGLLCFSAEEAVWLAGHGLRNLVVAYPTVQESTVRAVCRTNRACVADHPNAISGVGRHEQVVNRPG